MQNILKDIDEGTNPKYSSSYVLRKLMSMNDNLIDYRHPIFIPDPTPQEKLNKDKWLA